MEIKNIEEEKKKRKDGEEDGEQNKNGDSTQYRVVITAEANSELERYWKKAGEGKEPVQLTKSDLANYVLCNLSKFLTDSDIKTLRSLHFDERRVLQSLLKQSNDGSELPSELKRAIRDFYGVTERDKKRANKSAPDSDPGIKLAAS